MDDDNEQVDEVEQLADALDIESERRKWIRAAVAALEAKTPDPCSGRVALAYDMMRVAACERLVRILGSDDPTPS